MTEKVIGAISSAIAAEYPECEIYTENVEQGMKKPCFSIVLLEAATKRALGMGSRYFKRHLFCVHYFPGNDDTALAECRAVADNLKFILEKVTTEGCLIWSSGMHFEVVGGVLSFMVNYDFYVKREMEKADEMETLEYSQTLKGGD